MAISIKSLKTSESTLPPCIIIHAVEGIGKTSLAAEFPDAIYIQTAGERTPAGLSLPSPGEVTTYSELSDVLGELASDEHEFRTIVIDAVDGLEPIIDAETCLRNEWKGVDDGSKDTSYGKGIAATGVIWREMLAGLDYLRKERGMTIVLIAHSDRVTYEEPGKQPYKRFDLRIRKGAQAIICDWSDYILFVNSKTEMKEIEQGFNKKHTHAEGGGTRWIYTDARPAFVAKNRAKDMPAQIMYQKGKGFSELEKHLYPAADVQQVNGGTQVKKVETQKTSETAGKTSADKTKAA